MTWRVGDQVQQDRTAALRSGAGLPGRTEPGKRRSTNSYNPNATQPRPGSIWVWELDSPPACQLIVVLEVTWNGEEWWVKTKRLHDDMPESLGGPSSVALNDLGRFWEAVTAVRR